MSGGEIVGLMGCFIVQALLLAFLVWIVCNPATLKTPPPTTICCHCDAGIVESFNNTIRITYECSNSKCDGNEREILGCD